MRLFRARTPAHRPPASLRDVWWRHRVRLGLPLAVGYIVLARPTTAALAAGAAVALVGVLVRAVTAGYLRKNTTLATTGPYAVTRHPLYLGSALMAAGFLLAGRSIVAAVLGGVYFGFFYSAAMAREEAKLRARFGRTFDDWAARVPRFWPSVRARGVTAGGFSWRLYWRNGEYQAALGFVAGVALLWLKMKRG
jgi:protein-S-isoprenylcysteine O-methyltransferase Ste14